MYFKATSSSVTQNCAAVSRQQDDVLEEKLNVDFTSSMCKHAKIFTASVFSVTFAHLVNLGGTFVFVYCPITGLYVH